MSIKDYIIDFINYVFMLILISVFILYFIADDHFREFLEILRALMPLSFFALIFLIKFKLSRMYAKRSSLDGMGEIILYLSSFDKMWSELIVFILPFVICLLSFLFLGKVDSVDILQAVAAFLIMHAWHNYIFKKER